MGCYLLSLGAAMKRRTFITLIGATASSLVARAQQPAKMKRIAFVNPSETVVSLVARNHPFYRAFSTR
jgi:hypothetical protein